ncbi:hypothetical protein [Haladaptatus sp. ZSTT2]|uniref:hypothetical protein n=1 Tax=Haladaptatus sp. ZSTT2 TaxID=3120515 RepID=UPI00300F08A2
MATMMNVEKTTRITKSTKSQVVIVEAQEHEIGNSASVIDTANLSGNVKEIIIEAILQGELQVDNVSEELKEVLANFEYVTCESCGDRYKGYFKLSSYDMTSCDDSALNFNIDIREGSFEGEDPAIIDFTVRNQLGDPIMIKSGPPAPFGVLSADAPDNRHIPLWSESYTESEYVEISEEGISSADIELTTKLDGGESMTERYEIREKWPGISQSIEFPIGKYHLVIEMPYVRGDESLETLRCTVTWEIIN